MGAGQRRERVDPAGLHGHLEGAVLHHRVGRRVVREPVGGVGRLEHGAPLLHRVPASGRRRPRTAGSAVRWRRWSPRRRCSRRWRGRAASRRCRRRRGTVEAESTYFQPGSLNWLVWATVHSDGPEVEVAGPRLVGGEQPAALVLDRRVPRVARRPVDERGHPGVDVLVVDLRAEPGGAGQVVVPARLAGPQRLAGGRWRPGSACSGRRCRGSGSRPRRRRRGRRRSPSGPARRRSRRCRRRPASRRRTRGCAAPPSSPRTSPGSAPARCDRRGSRSSGGAAWRSPASRSCSRCRPGTSSRPNQPGAPQARP